MKTMIILGSEGYLGKAVQDHFQDQYHLIRVDIKQTASKEEAGVFSGFDLSNHDHIQHLITYLKEKELKVDAIVNLVGVNLVRNFYNISLNDWEKTMSTNVSSFLFFLKAVYPYLNTSVSIVVTASQNGVVAHEDRIDYGTSKAALIHLVKNLSIDFLKDSSKDIKINSISPSYILNDSNQQFFESYEGKKLIKKIPYKKLLVPEDVIHAIEFLVSDRSKAIRGQNLIIDYGYTLI
ncbi:SDR family oxidoreductase [Mesobacillus maritimus]|uniref:SDR family oxidoreductase n=1 Tax=Mesobacillus maritimus TaxID=1643336 RepID=UPI00203EA65B|nr:SDR family oxidoreductase [Mesobacillus maritimus]MCM3670967.1 SDR family oxidoreductase [Mesobacillus maritimus]